MLDHVSSSPFVACRSLHAPAGDERSLRRADILRALIALVAAGPLTALALPERARASGINTPLTCALAPAETEGPFFVDRQLERSDLRVDPSDGSRTPGFPLRLSFAVTHTTASGCTPVAGAFVDVWHADARGIYSGTDATKNLHFLRGYQRTDAAGRVTFTTIVPGWYAGRTPHIHFKIRTKLNRSKPYEFTSQLYFDEGLLDIVYRRSPYAARGPRPVHNGNDGIFTAPLASGLQEENGRLLLLALQPLGESVAGRFEVALNLLAPVTRGEPPLRPLTRDQPPPPPGGGPPPAGGPPLS